MHKDNINPYFQELSVDYLYHLGLDTSIDLPNIFADIKYVVFTCSNHDAALFAHQFAKSWYSIAETSFTFQPIFKTERYHLYKIGPLIIISHGIGMPSTLICLNEITKLMVHLGYLDVIFCKIGFADGIGVNEGDIVVTEEVVNAQLKPTYSAVECGVEYEYATQLDTELSNDLIEFNQKHSDFNVSCGKTLSAFDYYEGQLRLDGALEPSYCKNDRDIYLKLAQAHGVKSIDIESLVFAGFCHQLGIKACALNSIAVNRLTSDAVLADRERRRLVKMNAFSLLVQYIIFKLNVKN